MDSYVNLKKEVEELQNKLKKVEIDKINILMPLYEIEKNYKEQLGNILPENVKSVKYRNLYLRINVLEEEIKDLELEYEETKHIIYQIENAKQQLEENKKEEEEIRTEIKEKESKMQKRKDDVLNKNKEKEQIELEIKKINAEIEKHYLLQEKRDWEIEVVNSIDTVLKRLWNELEKKNIELDRFLNDKELIEDIKELTDQSPKIETKEEEDILNDATAQPEENKDIKEEDNSLLEIENEEKTSIMSEYSIPIEKDRIIKEQLEEALLAVEKLGKDNDESTEKNIQPEEITFEEQPKEEQTIITEDNPEFQNNEIEIMEENEEELEQDVEDVYDNLGLREKLKEKKERIALGISTIITKLIYKPKKIVNKSKELIIEVKNLVDNDRKKLTQEEVNTTVKTASVIKHKKDQILEDEQNKDYNNYKEQLKDLKNLNENLEKELNKIYLKEEFNIQDKPNERIKSK